MYQRETLSVTPTHLQEADKLSSKTQATEPIKELHRPVDATSACPTTRKEVKISHHIPDDDPVADLGIEYG